MEPEIYISPAVMPLCLKCGSDTWQVKQRIQKDSPLERVDKLGDLVVATPDPLRFVQDLQLHCNHCGAEYKPQPQVAAYHEHGGEDEYAWPSRVTEED